MEDLCLGKKSHPTLRCKKGLEIGGFRAMFRFQTVGTAGQMATRNPAFTHQLRLVVEILLFPVF